MPEPIATYQVRTRGLWNRRLQISNAQGPVGVLSLVRGAGGIVRTGTFRPEKGEVLVLRRDPGLLRSQFSLWTEGREWLGSSLRWRVVRREIAVHTGNKPLRLVPLPGFACGWSLQAPKTGEMARLRFQPLARRATLEVMRKVDFELVMFALFLGTLSRAESIWPGPSPEGESEPAAPSKAPAA